ncbi:ankyrin repeat domain-containing protein [Luteimonas sp. 3794]|uniref:ankyrin repeat domain-containing protein n=1 Tax=Luteimonas sp. 3794 TaxID=2817730 RepID=UPI00285FF72A|nr:ankyrin repeat domain-containing protein [Luteimonas sp. 3794]MDR6990166.1 ankyrin repeat protein [Luteimonas sp. 3794]
MVKFIASVVTSLLISTIAYANPVTQTAGEKHSMDEAEIYDAAVFGQFSRVEELLNQDPSLINAADKYGFTPLHGVVGEHYFDMARLLIARGANINASNDNGTTPLHLAAYAEMVEILAANGANLEARDSRGSTPLHAATEHPELIDVMGKLLQLGADVNAVDKSGLTPLDIATSLEEEDKVELLKRYDARSGNAR